MHTIQICQCYQFQSIVILAIGSNDDYYFIGMKSFVECIFTVFYTAYMPEIGNASVIGIYCCISHGCRVMQCELCLCPYDSCYFPNFCTHIRRRQRCYIETDEKHGTQPKNSQITFTPPRLRAIITQKYFEHINIRWDIHSRIE